MKSIKSVCSGCQECCKRYNVTILPEEAERIRKNLKLEEKEFIQKYCDLMLQFFPAKKLKNPFVIRKTKIPKNIQKKLKGKSNSYYFFVLPNILLKTKKNCVFLEKGLCLVNSVKPNQCNLFPFISLKKETVFWKKYPFCKLLKQEFKPKEGFKEKSLKHYKKVKNYFGLVKEKGFVSVWKNLPEKGKAFFEDEKICDMDEKEFFDLIKK